MKDIDMSEYSGNPDYEELVADFKDEQVSDAKACLKVGIFFLIFTSIVNVVYVSPNTGMDHHVISALSLHSAFFTLAGLLMICAWGMYSSRKDVPEGRKRLFILEKRISELEKKLGDKP